MGEERVGKELKIKIWEGKGGIRKFKWKER